MNAQAPNKEEVASRWSDGSLLMLNCNGKGIAKANGKKKRKRPKESVTTERSAEGPNTVFHDSKRELLTPLSPLRTPVQKPFLLGGTLNENERAREKLSNSCSANMFEALTALDNDDESEEDGLSAATTMDEVAQLNVDHQQDAQQPSPVTSDYTGNSDLHQGVGLKRWEPISGKFARTPDSQFLAIALDTRESFLCVGSAYLTVQHLQKLSYVGNKEKTEWDVSAYGYSVEEGETVRVCSPWWSAAAEIQLAPSRLDSNMAENRKSYHSVSMSAEEASDVVNLPTEFKEDIARMSNRWPAVLLFRAATPSYDLIECYEDQDSTGPSLPGFRVVLPSDTRLDRNRLAFVAPDTWFSLINSLGPFLAAPVEQKLSMLICGGKGVGKSTFSRFVVNQLLQFFPAVAYLESDLGQTEFSPPGFVSLVVVNEPLLGPAHTHLHLPCRSYYIGEAAPHSEPGMYLDAVRAVLDYYTQRWCGSNGTSYLPLIINTHGWVKALGHDLLSSVIDYSQPSHIVQIVGESNARNFTVTVPPNARLSKLKMWDLSPPQHTKSRPELRDLRLISYFLGRSSRPKFSSSYASNQELKTSLGVSFRQCRRYRVPWNAVALRTMHSAVAPSEILVAFNGGLVGLGIDTNGFVPATGDEVQTDSQDGGEMIEEDVGSVRDNDESYPRVLLQTPLIQCVGLGLIHRIDMSFKCFEIISPVNHELLKAVNVLLLGSIALPSSMLIVENSIRREPYLNFGSMSDSRAGASVMKSRNNVRRTAHASAD